MCSVTLAVMWPVDRKSSQKTAISRGPEDSSGGGHCLFLAPGTRSAAPQLRQNSLKTGISLTCGGLMYRSHPETGCSSTQASDFLSHRFDILRPGFKVGETVLCGFSPPTSPVPAGMSELGAGSALKWATRNLRKK